MFDCLQDKTKQKKIKKLKSFRHQNDKWADIGYLRTYSYEFTMDTNICEERKK